MTKHEFQLTAARSLIVNSTYIYASFLCAIIYGILQTFSSQFMRWGKSEIFMSIKKCSIVYSYAMLRSLSFSAFDKIYGWWMKIENFENFEQQSIREVRKSRNHPKGPSIHCTHFKNPFYLVARNRMMMKRKSKSMPIKMSILKMIAGDSDKAEQRERKGRKGGWHDSSSRLHWTRFVCIYANDTRSFRIKHNKKRQISMCAYSKPELCSEF